MPTGESMISLVSDVEVASWLAAVVSLRLYDEHGARRIAAKTRF